MADVLTIRTNEEAQARFKSFVEAGDFRSQNDFFNHLLTLYAAQETSIRTPTLESAISAVNELTERITKVLIGAGEVIFTNQEKQKAQIEALQQEANSKIEATKQEAEKKIASLTDENDSLKAASEEQRRIIEIMQSELSKAREHEKRLDQTLNDKAALIDGYREKIEGLESEINRQKVIVTEAMTAMTELDALRLKTKEQNLKIEHMTLEKDKALNDQKTLYEATIRQLELEAGQAKILSDKALIELETRLRKEMNDMQIQHGKSITDYESGYYSLLKELENLRIKETREPQNNS